MVKGVVSPGGIEGLINLLQPGTGLVALRAGEGRRKKSQETGNPSAKPFKIVKAMQDKLDKALAELSRLRQENATLREVLVKDERLPEYSKVLERSLSSAKIRTIVI